MFGFLTVDKPSGITSRSAVDKAKRFVRPAKIGHAGTLDPLATGVLVLCIGPATRLTQFVQSMPKTYVGEFQFGVTSPTDDIDSELQKVKNAVPVDRHAVQHELQNFVGEISQTPPDFSAVKVDGKRAYALSRMGRQVELKPKQVTVHDIEMLDFDYPNLRLAIRCGSGTYIRSIGRDLGKALGTGAIMTALTRTAVGCFKLDTAINLDNLSNKIIQEKLISPAAAFPEANQIVLTNEQIQKLANGHVFGEEELAEAKMDMQNIAIDTSNNLLAVFKAHRSGGHQPELNFVSYYGARNENSL